VHLLCFVLKFMKVFLAWEILDQIPGRATTSYSHSQVKLQSVCNLKYHMFILDTRMRFSLAEGHDEPHSSDAISLMRHNITHRDVQIEVEIVYITGTFIGSLWESITNVGAILLEVRLAKLQTRANGSGKEDSPACDVPGFENSKMTFMRHVSFVDFQVAHRSFQLTTATAGGQSKPAMQCTYTLPFPSETAHSNEKRNLVGILRHTLMGQSRNLVLHVCTKRRKAGYANFFLIQKSVHF
ncbi:ribonuclease TUDOR 1-like protein, partial [Tanacetum coccineum]